jgi:Spy/CpxP family protein refolding chaperone
MNVRRPTTDDRPNFAVLAVLLLLFSAHPALGQYPEGGMGNDGEFGHEKQHLNGPPVRSNPVITSVELEGPLHPEEFQKLFSLSPAQATEYAQVFDSFMVATNDPRDAARHRMEQLSGALGRDSAAVDYYRERIKELAKMLRDAQSRLDDRLKRLLTKDQEKQYKDWRKKEDDTARQTPVRRPIKGS